MSTRTKGTVTRASKSKFSYFLQLDGNDFYYNTKFKPKCGEGDVVGIEFDQKGPNRGQILKIKVIEDNSGGYDASNSERGSGDGNWSSGGSKPASGGGGGDDRQHQITWQSCQKSAATVVQALVAAGAIAEKGNAESKRAEIEGALDELTVRLYKDALDPKNSKTLKAVEGISSDAGDGSDDWDGDSDGDWDGDDSWD